MKALNVPYKKDDPGLRLLKFKFENLDLKRSIYTHKLPCKKCFHLHSDI